MNLHDLLMGGMGSRIPTSTPPFNPSSTPPTIPAGTPPTGLMAALNDPRMQIGLRMLMASSRQPGPRKGLGEILGGSVMGYQQDQSAETLRKLQEQLMQAQVARAQRPEATQPEALETVIGPDGKPQFVRRSEAAGMQPWMEAPRGAAADGPFGKVNPGDFTPESLEKYKASGKFSDLVMKPYAPPGFGVMQYGGGVGLLNRGTGGITPVTGGAEESAAAAARTAAEAAARENAQEQAKRDATFGNDMGVIEDEIARTQRLLTEFKSGKYQTGPIAGRLPNIRTSAQDLAREQGKDVIKAVSSATFGALSEGERGFLKELGVSETATEESNINMLGKRLEELTRAKRRLETRKRLTGETGGAPTNVRKYNPKTGKIE